MTNKPWELTQEARDKVWYDKKRVRDKISLEVALGFEYQKKMLGYLRQEHFSEPKDFSCDSKRRFDALCEEFGIGEDKK